MLSRIAAVLLLTAASGAILVPQTAAPADLVLLSGKILTVDDKFTEARALAVRDGRFIAVGSNEEARAHIGSRTRVIDGRGRTVIPGLIDTHVHALGVAAAEAVQPYRNLRSVRDLQDWIRTEAGRRPRGTWIWPPRTYPTRLNERRFPTRQELDDAAPNHPVAIDGAYAFSLNSAALRAAGITRDSDDPPGGAIVKDAAGEPTGLLRNVGGLLARFRSDAASTPPLDALERVHDQYIATGITSVIGGAPRSTETFRVAPARGPSEMQGDDHDPCPRPDDAWRSALHHRPAFRFAPATIG
jgi:predicted amidohydrolase YtcJ